MLATEAALKTYIGNGGCFFLSSQEYLYDKALGDGFNAAPNAFMREYLGFESARHDAADYASGPGISEFLVGWKWLNNQATYLHTPLWNAGGQVWSNVVFPDSQSVDVLRFWTVFEPNLLSEDPIGISKTLTTRRSIFWASSFEFFGDVFERNTVMR